MSKRMFFVPDTSSNNFYQERFVNFKFYTGFAITQKQKSIQSMHEAIKQMNQDYLPLEISTKSNSSLGQALSAFNLKGFCQTTRQYYSVENIFQSSKVFENGTQYKDLLGASPWEAKKDERLRSSGRIVKFIWENEEWPTDPRTMFYDWVYIHALANNKELVHDLDSYTAFTDIEFNHEKSINCQARAVAIFCSLYRRGVLESYLSDKELFCTIYGGDKQNAQLTFL